MKTYAVIALFLLSITSVFAANTIRWQLNSGTIIMNTSILSGTKINCSDILNLGSCSGGSGGGGSFDLWRVSNGSTITSVTNNTRVNYTNGAGITITQVGTDLTFTSSITQYTDALAASSVQNTTIVRLGDANKTLSYCGNITGATSNLCTITDTNTGYTQWRLQVSGQGTSSISNNTLVRLLSGNGISITNDTTNNLTITNTGVITETDPVWTGNSSTVVRNGTKTCASGTTLQNITGNSTGIYGDCVTSAAGGGGSGDNSGWVNASDNSNTHTYNNTGKVGVDTAAPNATLHINNTVTTQWPLAVQGASGQTADLTEFLNGSGTAALRIRYDGAIITRSDLISGLGIQIGNIKFITNYGNAGSTIIDSGEGGGGGLRFDSNLLSVVPAYVIGWRSSTDLSSGTPDTGLSRVSAGVVGVGTGASGSVTGTLKAGTLDVASSLGIIDSSGSDQLRISGNKNISLYPDGGAASSGGSGSVNVIGTSLTDPLLVLKASNNNSNDALQIKNNSGSSIFGIRPDGVIDTPVAINFSTTQSGNRLSIGIAQIADNDAEVLVSVRNQTRKGFVAQLNSTAPGSQRGFVVEDSNGNEQAYMGYAGVWAVSSSWGIFSGRVQTPLVDISSGAASLTTNGLDGAFLGSNAGMTIGPSGVRDASFTRQSAGVWGIGTGSATSTNGALQVGNISINTNLQTTKFDLNGSMNMSASNTRLYFSQANNTLAFSNQTNGCTGDATLSSGTITVVTNCAVGNYHVFLTDEESSFTNVGWHAISTRNQGNFTISSSNIVDASQVGWEIHQVTN